MKIQQTKLMALLLGVLVIISFVQAFQLTSLKAKVEEGQVSLGSGSSKTSAAGGSSGRTAELPSSVTELPQMVGGC